MNKFAPIVKRQIAWFEGQAARYSPDHPRYRSDKVEMYQRLAAEFAELLADLESRDISPTITASGTVLPPPAARSSLARNDLAYARPSSTSELADLPPELLEQLSEGARTGETDPLLQIIGDRGGTANLDEILIDLYRKHHEVGKRNIVANRLYRLSKRRLVWAVPGKKGIYTTTPPAGSPEGVVTLFGRDSNGKRS